MLCIGIFKFKQIYFEQHAAITRNFLHLETGDLMQLVDGEITKEIIDNCTVTLKALSVLPELCYMDLKQCILASVNRGCLHELFAQ